MRAILMGLVLAAAACTPSETTQEKSTPLPVILVVPAPREELHAATPKHSKKDELSITQQLNTLQGQLDWVSKRLPKEKE
jgi:hypothetical protein